MIADETSPPFHRIRLLPSGWTFECRPGQTLLQAGLAAGIELRSACRNGTCRACIAWMPEGTVRYGIDWPGLSADEKAEGHVLACVAIPVADGTLLQPHARRTAAAAAG